MAGSFTQKNQDTKQNSTTDPWAPTVPALTDFLGKLGKTGAGLGTLNPAETDAFGKLQANAKEGNPWASDISQLTDKFFGTSSRAPQVDAAYGTMKEQLTPYANGSNINLESNPYVRQMLDTISSDVSNQVNGQFAGAGRDLSGMHVKALGRGIAEGEAPVLSNLFTDAQNKQMQASQILGQGGMTAAQTGQALDKDALSTNALGTDEAGKALDAKNYGANTELTLQEQLKKLPVDQLGWLAQYLFPAAGLGQQSQGQQNTTQNGFSFGAKLI